MADKPPGINGTAEANSSGVAKFSPGSPIRVDSLNTIAARQNAIGVSSASSPWNQTPYGQIVNGAKGRRVAAIAPHPFKVVKANLPASHPDGPAACVRVVFGTVNSVVPTILDFVTLDDVALDATTDTPPRSPILGCAENGGVWLKATWVEDEFSLFAVSSVELVFLTESPSDDDTHSHKRVANVTVASEAVTAVFQAITSSYDVQRVKCGGAPAQYFWTGITT